MNEPVPPVKVLARAGTSFGALAAMIVALVAAGIPLTGLAQDINYTITQHGAACRAEIGPMQSFSCLEGQIIPVTNNGLAVTTEADLDADRSCDRPAWLGLGNAGQCVPFSRLGRLPGVDTAGQANENIQWRYICRRYQFRGRDDSTFDDVAVIGHNRSTGATCFFQALTNLDGSDVPSPTSTEPAVQARAQSFWLKPIDTAHIVGGGGCDFCHDSDPFIHTPYVDQVKLRDGSGNVVVDDNGIEQTLVPKTPAVDASYRHVGDLFQPPPTGLWPKPTHIAPPDSECLECHRVGSRNSCATFARWATGTAMEGLNATFRAYPRSHWMPFSTSASDAPISESLENQTIWEERYRESVEEILRCCDNPDASGCGGLRQVSPD